MINIFKTTFFLAIFLALTLFTFHVVIANPHPSPTGPIQVGTVENLDRRLFRRRGRFHYYGHKPLNGRGIDPTRLRRTLAVTDLPPLTHPTIDQITDEYDVAQPAIARPARLQPIGDPRMLPEEENHHNNRLWAEDENDIFDDRRIDPKPERFDRAAARRADNDPDYGVPHDEYVESLRDNDNNIHLYRTNGFMDDMRKMRDTLVDGTTKAWAETKNKVHDAYDTTSDAVGSAYTTTRDKLHNAYDASADGMYNAYNATSHAASHAYDTTRDKLHRAYDVTANATHNGYDKTTDKLRQAYEATGDGLHNAYHATADTVHNAYDKTADQVHGAYDKTRDAVVN